MRAFVDMTQSKSIYSNLITAFGETKVVQLQCKCPSIYVIIYVIVDQNI